MSITDKEKVLECLRELADQDLQQRIWLASSGSDISSLTEAVCGLFDDSGLDVALEKGQVVFSREIDVLLSNLRGVTREIDEFQSPAQVMIDPKMTQVRELARKILARIIAQFP